MEDFRRPSTGLNGEPTTLATESDKPKVSVKAQMKETFVQNMETTPIHGLPNIVRTKYWYMRLFWILFFSVFAGFGTWLIIKAIMDYCEYPVVSSVAENVEQQPDFPSVTICNLDALATSYADSYMDKTLFELFKINPDEINTRTIAIHNQLRQYVLNKISDPAFDYAHKQKFGYSIDETLIDCHYNDENCLRNTSLDFTWYYSYKYGNCFTFNSGFTYLTDFPSETTPRVDLIAKTVKKPGVQFGLNLEMFAGSRDTLYSLKTYGAILFVHNQTSRPENSAGILLKPGSQTNIEVKKAFTSILAKPYSDCEDLTRLDFDRTLYSVLESHSLEYTQQDCLDLCMQQEIIAICKCYFLEFFQLNNTRPCLSLSEIECANKYYEQFNEKDIVNLCQKQCPLECDSQKYDYTISTSGYPSDGYLNVLKTLDTVKGHYNKDFPLTDDQLKRDVLSVNVYFNDFLYVETTHARKMTEIDLLANIGGTLGLCIGLSLTSVVQVFEMAFEMLKIVVKKLRNKA